MQIKTKQLGMTVPFKFNRFDLWEKIKFNLRTQIFNYELDYRIIVIQL